jgi:hypothetical protein
MEVLPLDEPELPVPELLDPIPGPEPFLSCIVPLLPVPPDEPP